MDGIVWYRGQCVVRVFSVYSWVDVWVWGVVNTGGDPIWRPMTLTADLSLNLPAPCRSLFRFVRLSPVRVSPRRSGRSPFSAS